jgi:hypothetical protein
MSDPQDHSRSGSERGAGEEAQRFWGEYARRPRPGGHREQRESAREAANGHGTSAGHSHECLEWCPICRTADVLRASAPPELRDQVQTLQHDALVTFRALIDAYIDRLENGSRRRESAVEDIPIE